MKETWLQGSHKPGLSLKNTNYSCIFHTKMPTIMSRFGSLLNWQSRVTRGDDRPLVVSESESQIESDQFHVSGMYLAPQEKFAAGLLFIHCRTAILECL